MIRFRRNGMVTLVARVPLGDISPAPFMFGDRLARMGEVGCLGIRGDFSPDVC